MKRTSAYEADLKAGFFITAPTITEYFTPGLMVSTLTCILSFNVTTVQMTQDLLLTPFHGGAFRGTEEVVASFRPQSQ